MTGKCGGILTGGTRGGVAAYRKRFTMGGQHMKFYLVDDVPGDIFSLRVES